MLAVYVTHPITKHLLISLSHSHSQLISNAFIYKASIHMVTAVPVSVSSPVDPFSVPHSPSSPSIKATAPTKNKKRQWNGSPKEMRATGMQPGVLTQELTMPSLGTLDTSSVSDLSMSVGTPAAGARVKDTPKTSACRATNGRGKKRASTAAAGENAGQL